MESMAIREALNAYKEVVKITAGEWEDGCEDALRELVDTLAIDLQSTEEFLQYECSLDDLVWISDGFDELVEKSQSRELIQSFRRLIEEHSPEGDTYHLREALSSAERYLVE